MRESSAFQYLVKTEGKAYYERHILPKIQQVNKRKFQQRYEKGAREVTIRNLLTVLEFRFDGLAVQALGPGIETIQESLSLKDLYREALHAETFEAFARALGAALDAQD